MLSFSNFLNEERLPRYLLNEGGNVQIGDQAAQHINLEDHDRDIVADQVMKGLVEFNNSFKDELGLYIWKPSILKDGKIFSGSTKHFFDSRITTEKFLQHKKSVGDIDLMVDENLKLQIRKFVEDHKGEDFGPMNLIGHKPAGDQTITLWTLEPMGINIQVDLEFVSFLENKPTKWAEFSHSSSFADIESGIKGAFHKLLMTSLMGHKKTDSILQLKTKQNEIKAGTYALSVKGLRKKFEKIGMQDGKPVVKETGSKDYNTNFYDIIKEVFGVDATEEDIEDFWSFTGILKIAKKYMPLNERQKVFDEFLDRIFGPDAQGLYRGEPNRDLDEKMVAVNLAKEKLDVSLGKDNFERMKADFYKKYK